MITMAFHWLAFLLIAALDIFNCYAQTPDAVFTINEEIPIGRNVGNMSGLSSILAAFDNEDRRSLQFGILNQGSPPGSLFDITSNGVIFVARRVDREALCLGLSDCELKINVLVTSQRSSQVNSEILSVTVKVNDVNDMAPTFERDEVILEVSERNSLDSVLKISGANDKDFKDEFKIKRYSLSAYEDVFLLTDSQTLDGSSEIDLKLLQSLDRETQSLYKFTITAYDGGSPPKSGELSVKVYVTDKNDNEPIFLNSTYSVTLEGTPPLNEVILQVSASDADEGLNALVTYDFSNLQKPLLKNKFYINSTSGEISVIGTLRASRTEFIVEAQDSGSPRLKTQTVVTVVVVNTGNIAPKVTITSVGANADQNVVYIMEPAGRGLFVAFVDVVDDNNDVVTCDINSDVFRMEAEKNKGYKILLQGTVDRETRDNYDLSVVCEDDGDPNLESMANITIKILDYNDNTPVFTQTKYVRSMKEGQKTGEFVVQVKATDEDIGKNGNIRYSLDDRFRQYFTIGSRSGNISAVGELDRESFPVMELKVFATDQGETQKLQTSADVTVVLEDINDNKPRFTKTVFDINVKEEQNDTKIIGNLEAEDEDAGINGEMEFFFTGSTDGAEAAFKVLENGSIQSTSRLDREERENYTFTVMVRDKGNPQLMSSASVVVRISDINDNTPAILFPKSQNHTILISTVPETGVVLSRIIAIDYDARDNGRLNYAIVAGNEDRAFEITPNVGELKIADANRLKNKRKYNVKIIVSDNGSPRKFNTTALRVDVQFENVTFSSQNVHEEKQEDYIIIVAVVGAITVIFSTLIIVAICVVFQKDRVSRRKSEPKAAFHNLHAPENLSDDEKVSTTVPERASAPPQHQYSMNDLSSPPGKSGDGTFFQVKLSFPESQNSAPPKGKAVSFSLEEDGLTASSPRQSSPREESETFSTFGSPRGRQCDDVIFSQRSTMTRQVSGVTYSPISTNVHGDDVRSDTSADTNTSDSGRGTSVDDVNFEQILKDDQSPVQPPRRRSGDFSIPPRKPMAPDTGRSSYHVRFAQQPAKPFPQNSSMKKSNSHHYDGGKPFNNVHFDSKQTPGRAFSNNNDFRMPSSNLTTFSPPRHVSVTSLDDDATTTTSGSYVISPEDVRMDALVGSDVIV